MSQQQLFILNGKHLVMPECYVDIKSASKYTSLPVKNLYEWAGLVEAISHTCRHTFCTRLVEKGIDIYKIAIPAGHEDIRMTQRYSNHSSESLRDGVEILDSDCNLTDLRKIFTCKDSLRALLTINYNNNLVHGSHDCR